MSLIKNGKLVCSVSETLQVGRKQTMRKRYDLQSKLCKCWTSFRHMCKQPSGYGLEDKQRTLLAIDIRRPGLLVRYLPDLGLELA